jgi:predicted SAM-dependent methyltransferase
MIPLDTPWIHLFNLLPKLVTPGRLPPECDTGFYREIHDDLARFSDDELRVHFCNHGIREGRIGSPAAHRAGFLATIPQCDRLEIGPFTRPTLRGPNVKYLDVMDKAELLKRAAEHHYPAETAVEIDYVSSHGSLEMVPDRSFDVVFSSHCIEHQPDLIGHLNEVERVLRPGGRYFLIVPDRRYCFDHYIEPSPIEEVLAAHAEKRTAHTRQSVVNHYTRTTHNHCIRHWCGDHGDPPAQDQTERIASAERRHAQAAGSYLDVHAWQFEPATFRRIMTELRSRRAIGLQAERVYETVWGQLEFTAVLRKDPRFGWSWL